jgi:hypothetical protein
MACEDVGDDVEPVASMSRDTYATALPERLARDYLWRGIPSSESNVNLHWMAEQERRLTAAIRAALDEAAQVARDIAARDGDALSVAAAIAALKG